MWIVPPAPPGWCWGYLPLDPGFSSDYVLIRGQFPFPPTVASIEIVYMFSTWNYHYYTRCREVFLGEPGWPDRFPVTYTLQQRIDAVSST